MIAAEIMGGLVGLAVLLKIVHQLGGISRGLNGLVKVVDDHETRIREIEHDG